MIEGLPKNLDDNERDEAERNKATGFNIFTAAKARQSTFKISQRESKNINIGDRINTWDDFRLQLRDYS